MLLALCQAFSDSFEFLRSLLGLTDDTSDATALLMEWPQQQGCGNAQVYSKW